MFYSCDNKAPTVYCHIFLLELSNASVYSLNKGRVQKKKIWNFKICSDPMHGVANTMHGAADTMSGAADTMHGAADTMRGAVNVMHVRCGR